MIVKSKGRKDRKFGQLVRYVLRDKNRITNLHDHFMICHNIDAFDEQGIIAEFEDNDQYRRRRKNGNVMYHEILSFSPDDRDVITLPMLEDIAHKYIELRGTNALCLAKPHVEEKHIHIHFVFSGTEMGSRQVLRISRNDFKKVRREIEQYQLERYPELSASYVQSRDKEKYQDKDRSHIRTHKADQITKRKGRQTIKEVLGEQVQTLFHQANTMDAFCESVEKNLAVKVYFRRGRAEGIWYKNRKYRFTTIGIDKLELNKLREKTQVLAQKRRELDQLYQDKEKRKERNKGRSKDDIWGL